LLLTPDGSDAIDLEVEVRDWTYSRRRGREILIVVGSARAEGSGSTASQRTHREPAPGNAARKVPVPWCRECRWETTGSR